MIKLESVGQLDIAKINPVLTHTEDVKLYSFLTVDGILYLIANTLTGDDAYQDDVVIKKGDFLNGYQMDMFAGQKFVIDAKHIKDEYTQLEAKKFLKVSDEGGGLEKADSAPEDQTVYFEITEKCTLTGPAVKARVIVAPKAAE